MIAESQCGPIASQRVGRPAGPRLDAADLDHGPGQVVGRAEPARVGGDRLPVQVDGPLAVGQPVGQPARLGPQLAAVQVGVGQAPADGRVGRGVAGERLAPVDPPAVGRVRLGPVPHCLLDLADVGVGAGDVQGRRHAGRVGRRQRLEPGDRLAVAGQGPGGVADVGRPRVAQDVADPVVPVGQSVASPLQSSGHETDPLPGVANAVVNDAEPSEQVPSDHLAESAPAPTTFDRDRSALNAGAKPAADFLDERRSAGGGMPVRIFDCGSAYVLVVVARFTTNADTFVREHLAVVGQGRTVEADLIRLFGPCQNQWTTDHGLKRLVWERVDVGRLPLFTVSCSTPERPGRLVVTVGATGVVDDGSLAQVIDVAIGRGDAVRGRN